MGSVFNGRVVNGVVVFDGGDAPAEGARLPEGTRVTIVPVQEADDVPVIESIYDMAKLAVPCGIPDLSRNIDHYLYGHPKVSDDRP